MLGIRSSGVSSRKCAFTLVNNHLNKGTANGSSLFNDSCNIPASANVIISSTDGKVLSVLSNFEKSNSCGACSCANEDIVRSSGLEPGNSHCTLIGPTNIFLICTSEPANKVNMQA